MNKNKDPRQMLVSGCKNFDIHLTEEQVDKFFAYYELLIEWNGKMNLTTITELEDVIVKHFIDSLSICKYVDIEDEDTIIDVGTGAGFPGIPIKIVYPNVKITLVDSLNKRVKFLDEVIKQLKLKNIETIHARVEDLAHDIDHRQSYDYCMSRAVANLAALTEYCLPFIKVGGQLLALKGPSISEEIENSGEAIKILGGVLSNLEFFDIPYSDLKHNLVIIDKELDTPLKFPRKTVKIKKSPL